jgi:ketosteroid isomerase-like protein
MPASRLLATALPLAALLAACTAPAPEPVDVAAEEAALNASMERFSEAAMAGDIETAATFMTEDFELREPGINAGRAAWVTQVTDVMESGARLESFDTRTEDYFLHGDAAYEVGEYDETIVMGDDRQVIEGYYFLRWEKGADGVWRMDRMVAGPREMPGSTGEM